MTWHGWERQLLVALGGEPRPEPVRFLRAWAAAEGGGATFNPLNTTMSVPGATSYNKVGVRNYPDELAGLAATLLTLRLPYYRHLVAGLRSRTMKAEQILSASVVDVTTWGTGSAPIAAQLRRH